MSEEQDTRVSSPVTTTSLTCRRTLKGIKSTHALFNIKEIEIPRILSIVYWWEYDVDSVYYLLPVPIYYIPHSISTFQLT